ncbi:hypothetical protein [Algibacillus agarilyticus]|uniref:hypothetical protein n=1 Tax=Algibacillus agarilyticus TaxID=2234133 RepID=UPI000DD03EDC|nr:hypothetical protein [Algibacillus agarilyticus]
MKTLYAILILFSFLAGSYAYANDQLVVVVNKNNPIEKMNKSEVIDLFMGKYVAFPNGEKATPVEMEGENLTKQAFYEQLVGMSLSRINAYWSRIRFSGRTRSSIQQNNEDDLMVYINNTESAIGYIPRSKVTDDVKVVFELNE